MKIKIIRLRCERCGHEWIPHSEEVRICPKCKSSYWDVPISEKRLHFKSKRKDKEGEIA